MPFTITPVERGWERSERLLDFDLTPAGKVIAITAGARTVLSFGGAERFTVPTATSGISVAAINEQQAVVVEDRTAHRRPNAFLMSADGAVSSFFVGDAVEDVLVLRNGSIVITYFDQGISKPLGEEGLAVFAPDGELVRGYRTSTGRFVLDCHAVVAVGARSVGFLPYPGHELVIWNVETGTHASFVLPDPCRRANAISHAGDRWWFHVGPMDNPTLCEWKLGSTTVEVVGMYTGRLRGKPGGRFLDGGAKGPALLTMS